MKNDQLTKDMVPPQQEEEVAFRWVPLQDLETIRFLSTDEFKTLLLEWLNESEVKEKFYSNKFLI